MDNKLSIIDANNITNDFELSNDSISTAHLIISCEFQFSSDQWISLI